MAKQISYRMNFNLAGFKEGDEWNKGFEPDIVKIWVKQDGGSFKGGQRIITTMENGIPVEPVKRETFTICPNCGYPDIDIVNAKRGPGDDEIIYCLGKNQDGSSCKFNGEKLRENGYCFKHQDQVPKNGNSNNLKPEEGNPES